MRDQKIVPSGSEPQSRAQLDILIYGEPAALGAEALRADVCDKVRRQRQALVMVVVCTLLGGAAEIFMKSGVAKLGSAGLLAVLTMLGGYSLYRLSTFLLILALRDGELSRLYPVTALTYVWVAVLSLLIAHDRLNVFKLIGIAIIVIGVAVLGSGREN